MRIVNQTCSSEVFGVDGQESWDEISYRVFFKRRALQNKHGVDLRMTVGWKESMETDRRCYHP